MENKIMSVIFSQGSSHIYTRLVLKLQTLKKAKKLVISNCLILKIEQEQMIEHTQTVQTWNLNVLQEQLLPSSFSVLTFLLF